jgi:NAD(P)H-dependent FMN reductase
MSTRILALVGSLRSGSDNRRLAEAPLSSHRAASRSKSSTAWAISPCTTKAATNRGNPTAADRLRAEVQSADALLFVSPEYNGVRFAVRASVRTAAMPYGVVESPGGLRWAR